MGASHRFTAYDGLLSLALLGFAVFAWLPDSYFRMVSWPWILVWQGAFLLVTGTCLWQLRRFDQPFYGLGFGLDWVVTALLGCLVLTTAAAEFPLLAIQNSLLVGCYVILLYGLRHAPGLQPLRLCQGVVWVGAIAAIISLILWRPTVDMWLSDNFYDAIRNRFPLGHHNFTGGYFVLVLPLAVGLAGWYKTWRRWTYGLISGLMAMALYASGSRGAWLGGIVLILGVIIVSIIRSRGKQRRWAITLSIVTLGIVLVLLVSNPRIRTLIPLAPTDILTNPAVVSDGPTVDRFFMAQATGNVLRHRPLLGLGPGNLGRLYDRYRPVMAGTGLSQVQQLHNTPLQIVAELGLGGGLIYLGSILCLFKWLRYLQHQAVPVPDKWSAKLLCIGLLGYGISSLSDYQLENIPIAVTLIVLVAAITQVASEPSAGLSRGIRRWLSLLLLTTFVITLHFWLRTDLAILFTHQGVRAISQGNVTRAGDKFYTAAQIAPWDPTPIALAAQQLDNMTQTTNHNHQTTLQQEALSLYQQALKVAPNDIWFNQNVAVLAWQTGDVVTAHQAISKVVQLSPRSQNHSYYLLGLTSQMLGDTEATVAALALECLVNPQVFTFESWQHELAPLKQAVSDQVLKHYGTILAGLGVGHPLSSQVQNHMAAVRWWANGVSAINPNQVDRLLLKALIALEDSPDQSMQFLDICIAAKSSSSEAQRCSLLKAWLRPHEYLSIYLQTLDIEEAEKEVLRSHIITQRSLRNWLCSTTSPVENNQRVALSLLYRNYYASKISSILIPDNLQQFSLPVSLGLFSLNWPRELPVLDDLVETLRTETLGLPHPTRNNFRLSSAAT
ncbi:O-antigen ligase family protein [Leptothoe spongobia]|uniref:O-antigen ligase family protein n=1 Tax=Leptothoe spongobia TAU-MAC 1115 TaxID=1967444 RepID=A0A947DDV9_9CYAN|nr:O-antigen ligase family protein [Leptothoe spongobia]MBT9315233.1 O-antigen ligase family protein [Leptothoe spongobia TAU-MAC 1115]